MASLSEIVSQMRNTLQGSTLLQKALAALVLLIVVGGLLALVLGGDRTSYKVLYSGLTQEDAAEVVARLQEQRVPYTLSEAGNSILVPASQVYELRLNMAGAGLPRGGGAGFELFDKTSLGTTDFVQRLNYQRALQGELVRTIKQFQQVQEARVHIAVPKESVFVEEEKPPTAAVSVKLYPGQKLSQLQVQSIVHLVASSIPGMSSENVTLVDTAGRLLFRSQSDADTVLSGTQLEYQFKLEESFRGKVETLLEEIVGVNHARARVTADLDFSRVNSTQESFDPEGQVVRSEQSMIEDDLRGGYSSGGIPGVKGELATFAGGASGGESGGGNFKRNNTTRNYEISKQTRHVEESAGSIKRLSVAVMVDGTYEKGEEGAEGAKYVARSPEEMEYFTRLVKNAIGYNEDRGDQVEVVNMSFALSTAREPEAGAFDHWRGLIEQGAMPILYLLIALVVFFAIINPLLKMVGTSSPVRRQPAFQGSGQALPAAAESEEDLQLAPRALSDKEKIYALAKSDPDRAADLVKKWLHEG